jgi:hypothetical protein
VTLVPDGPQNSRFAALLERLGRLSIDDYYNPYRMFDWPDALPQDRLWMTPELLSVHNTPYFDQLSREQLIRLSRWESVNFYSLNVHGIRELLIEVIGRVHLPGFELASEYLHHLIGEENEHMWFFAQFCRRYGGKVYRFPRARTAAPQRGAVEHFLVFAKVLLFEEIVDHCNRMLSQDTALHETIRLINGIHHRDESRHIAFNREFVALLGEELRDQLSEKERAETGGYLRDYLSYCVGLLYSLEAYRDTGIADPLSFRRAVMAHPGRRAAEARLLRRPGSFLRKIGIYEETSCEETTA